MANFNFNKVILGGRLTADPELKQTQSGIAVVSFSIAVNRRYTKSSAQQSETDFFNVTAWRQTAEFVSRYFKKGSSICVVGTIQNSTWTDQQGAKHYRTDIVADEVMFVDSRSESGNSFGGDDSDTFGGSTPSFSTPSGAAPKFEEIKTDDDLPF
ncbi:MAG: single-stranded DNA-binding protein [Clostridia bacterium]|nr:single-stranded DNA-binding protein [Clostridia bacterium]